MPKKMIKERNTMGRKTVEDLDPEPGSVGGAMSQWPRRTLNWLCRDQRVNAVDPNVAEHLLDRETRDLRRLTAFAANEVGIEASTLDLRRRALEKHETDKILMEIRQGYYTEYSEGDMHNCPFEDSGLDKACWRCPVAGNVLEKLVKEL